MAARLYGGRVLFETRAFKLKIAFENKSLWRATRIKNTLQQLDRVMRSLNAYSFPSPWTCALVSRKSQRENADKNGTIRAQKIKK